jgi:hypothetical protein
MKKTIERSPITWFSLKNAFRSIPLSGAMVSLENSFELSALVRRLGWRVISACSEKPVKLTSRLVLLKGFTKYLFRMKKHHGSTYVVKYLKACQLALQKAISKDRIKSLRELDPDLPLPRLTSTGLPRFIPLQDRRSIIGGNLFVIRF